MKLCAANFGALHHSWTEDFQQPLHSLPEPHFFPTFIRTREQHWLKQELHFRNRLRLPGRKAGFPDVPAPEGVTSCHTLGASEGVPLQVCVLSWGCILAMHLLSSSSRSALTDREMELTAWEQDQREILLHRVSSRRMCLNAPYPLSPERCF